LALIGFAAADAGNGDILDKNIRKSPYKSGGPVTIHLVPHSHDDVGWCKTIDEYFDGTDKQTQWTNVNIQLTNVMYSLLDNPQRTFSEVEIKFFKMWWDR